MFYADDMKIFREVRNVQVLNVKDQFLKCGATLLQSI